MTNWHWAAIIAIGLSVALAFQIPLLFSQAAALFGAVALGFAYPTIQFASSTNIAAVFIAVLAIYASWPLKQLLPYEGLLADVGLSLLYAGVIFLAGAGWKRRWT